MSLRATRAEIRPAFTTSPTGLAPRERKPALRTGEPVFVSFIPTQNTQNKMSTTLIKTAAAAQASRTFRLLPLLAPSLGVNPPPRALRAVESRRAEIAAAIAGEDPRMVVFVGPCSVHHVGAARDYLARLRPLSAELGDRLIVVPRLFFEKPRTVRGWTGLVVDPGLDQGGDVRRGIRASRALLCDAAAMGLPAITEMLSPNLQPHLEDLLAAGAIGARTVESQTHRQMASAAPFPVGFKNATCGNVQAAVDAMSAARAPHRFLASCPDTGLPAVCRSVGNAGTFAILRGGRSGENFDEASVRATGDSLAAAGFARRRIVVDASHANCGKDYRRQRVAFLAAAEHCRRGLAAGAMLESFLAEGAQKLPEDLCGFGARRVRRDVSVTDPCVGWEETEELLRAAHGIVGRG